MRYLRYLLLGFGATLLLVGLTLAIAMLYFRVSLARLVMQQVEAQTGLRVLSINAYVQFAPRLTVQFEHAEVLDHGRSIGRLEKLKLLFSYTALLRRSGLPLYRIVLDHPEFHLPSSVQEPFLPRLDAAAAQLLEQSLATLSRATRHLDVIAATVLGADNEPLLEGLNVEAYQRLLSGTRWRLNFDSTWVGTPLKHAHLAGTVNLGARKAAPGTPIAQGELWFWSVSLDGLPLFPGLESRGQLQGSLSLTLRDDGTAVGDSAIKIIAAGLAGQRLVAATPPLDLTFDTVLDSSPERLALRKIELWQGRQIVLAGDGYLAQPYSPNPTLALRLGGITLNASQLRKALSSLREPPRWMATYAARLRSGELRVNQVALDSTLDELKAASPRLAKRLNLDATLEALSFALPPDLQLPPVEKLDATMLMRQSVLTISQGSAILGNSHLTGFDARVDFSRGLENPSYSTKLSGDLDLGSLYSQSAALTKAIPFVLRQTTYTTVEDHIWEWETDQRLLPGAATFKDYNFTTPSADLTAKTQHEASHPYAKFEVYEFPGPYAVVADGTTISNVRMQRFTRESLTLRGVSNSRLIYTGCKLTMSGFADSSQNIEYLVTGADYTLSEAEGVPTTDGSMADTFVCTFRAIPGTVPFQLEEITRWPRMHGPQTAKVVVASGDEITTDSYGRIKVKFPWDRSSAQDDTASCWIRVAQIWAGSSWGGMYIPRVGMEVVVDFLNGSPDRPIIVGCVYNATNMPSDALPANKTRSNLQSNSSTGGGGFNQFRFEDKKGSEEVYFQAQKDYNKLVKNNETVTVDQGNRSITLNKGDNSFTVSQGKNTVTIQKDNSVTIQQGNNSLTVSQGNNSTTVSTGNNSTTISQGNESLTVSTGNHSITVSAGSSSVTAGQSITLTVGSNSIAISTSGITINGSMVTVQASGDLTLQGSMVAIN